MVLSDIVLEYESVKNIMDNMIEFAEQAQNILSIHSKAFKSASTTYFKNTGQSTASTNFGNTISSSLSSVNDAILRLNSQTRVLYKCIGLLEKMPITNTILSNECSCLIDSANDTIDKMYEIIESKTDVSKKNGYYSDFLNLLIIFLNHYNHIVLLHKHFAHIEETLLEPLPDSITSEEVTSLVIRSDKKCTDFSVYSEDIRNLSRFLEQFEMLMCPHSSNNIFTRKIENGSLKIMWDSKEIDLSLIGSIIETIINAIKSFAFLPSELKKKKLENQTKEIENDAKRIENESARTELNSKKLIIINSQIDTIIDKLGLDKNNPSDREKIQLLCVPLVDFLENNPQGSVNCIKYDLHQEMRLLEDKNI